MKDRVIVGFIAGILAAVGADIVNWTLFALNFSEKRFLDWAAVIFLGHLPSSTAEIIACQLVQMLWDGMLGVLFALIVTLVESEYIIVKSTLYAVSLLFIFRAITVLYQVPFLSDLPLKSFLSHILCSIVWGVLAGYFLKKNNALLD